MREALRTNPWVTTSLALANAYVLWIMSQAALDLLAVLVVRPPADPSAWLGDLGENVVLAATLVWSVSIGVVTAMGALLFARVSEQGSARVRLVLWLSVALALAIAPTDRVRSVPFAAFQWSTITLAAGSLVVLARHSRERWRSAPSRRAGAQIGAPGA